MNPHTMLDHTANRLDLDRAFAGHRGGLDERSAARGWRRTGLVARRAHHATRHTFSMLVPPGRPIGSPQVIA